jgi:hypothetical protein
LSFVQRGLKYDSGRRAKNYAHEVVIIGNKHPPRFRSFPINGEYVMKTACLKYKEDTISVNLPRQVQRTCLSTRLNEAFNVANVIQMPLPTFKYAFHLHAILDCCFVKPGNLYMEYNVRLCLKTSGSNYLCTGIQLKCAFELVESLQQVVSCSFSISAKWCTYILVYLNERCSFCYLDCTLSF